jgi:hypothetical protein
MPCISKFFGINHLKLIFCQMRKALRCKILAKCWENCNQVCTKIPTPKENSLQKHVSSLKISIIFRTYKYIPILNIPVFIIYCNIPLKQKFRALSITYKVANKAKCPTEKIWGYKLRHRMMNLIRVNEIKHMMNLMCDKRARETARVCYRVCRSFL